MSVDGLTPRQQAFVAEYLVDKNGKQAAIRAGYSPKGAEVTASKMLRIPKVAAAVQAGLAEVTERAKVKAEDIIRELGVIALMDPGRMLDEDGHPLRLKDMPEDMRRAMKTIKLLPKGGREYTFLDKVAALTTLARHFKLLTDKVEVSGTIGLADRLREARKRAGLA